MFSISESIFYTYPIISGFVLNKKKSRDECIKIYHGLGIRKTYRCLVFTVSFLIQKIWQILNSFRAQIPEGIDLKLWLNLHLFLSIEDCYRIFFCRYDIKKSFTRPQHRYRISRWQEKYYLKSNLFWVSNTTYVIS